MTTPPVDVRTPLVESNQPIKRRGLFAAAAACAAMLVARWTEQPVLAGADGDVILGGLGAANSTTQSTAVLHHGSESPGGGPAIHGFRSPGAVSAVTPTFNIGVLGQTFASNSAGVQGGAFVGSQAKGVHGTSPVGYGVFGDGPTGVHGESTSNIGVQGVIPSGSANAMPSMALTSRRMPVQAPARVGLACTV